MSAPALVFAPGLTAGRCAAWRADLAAWGVVLPETSGDTAFRQPESGLYLFADEEVLWLAKAGNKARVCADFTAGAAHYRRVSGGGELISRAVQPQHNPVVWDATAGLGRDAFVLAGVGTHVYALERDAAVYALLADGLRRAAAHPDTAATAARICLRSGSLNGAVPADWPVPDVIYLDPMYPQRRKSAAVKKEMAYFHELVGVPSSDEERALLQAARRTARRRVVVKRPIHGECLGGEKAAFQYGGKAVRFDVYLPAP